MQALSIITITREDFLRRYDNLETKIAAIKALKKWDQFLLSKNIIEPELFKTLRTDNGNQKYVLLDQFARFPIPQPWFVFVKAWIKYNDINLDNDKIKDYVRWPKKMREREKGIDKEILTKIVRELTPFYKVVVFVAFTSGMRIRSEVLNKMEWSWLDETATPVKITIPAQYTKTKQERITFLTPQAYEMVKQLPRDSVKVFPRSYSSFYKHWSSIRNKLGLTERKMSGVFQSKPHRFRGYAENKLSKAVGEEFAHAITGHGNYLGQYFAGGTTDKEAGQDYLRAVKDLTIENLDLDNEPHSTNDI